MEDAIIEEEHQSEVVTIVSFSQRVRLIPVVAVMVMIREDASILRPLQCLATCIPMPVVV